MDANFDDIVMTTLCGDASQDENSTISLVTESRQQEVSPRFNSSLNNDTSAVTPLNTSLNVNTSLTHSMTLGRHDNHGKRRRGNLVARSTSIPAQKFYVTIDNQKHRFVIYFKLQIQLSILQFFIIKFSYRKFQFSLNVPNKR